MSEAKKVESLGILVSSDRHLDHILKLTEAACAKKKTVEIFFTGKGVLLTQDPAFERLAGRARLSVCDLSFQAMGLSGSVPGVGVEDFTTQARIVEMIERCDRYVVF